MIQNKVVFRYADGRTVKGFTADFSPNKEIFHVTPEEPPGSSAMPVRVGDLKAVFFVKDLAGHPEYKKTNDFNGSKAAVGRRIKVIFKDGETLVGTTQGYQPQRLGFFVVPADSGSNNERCFVVNAATQEVTFI